MNNEFQENNNKESYGKLPIWNLNDLYSSPNSKKLRDDFILLEDLVKKFSVYKGNVSSLKTNDFTIAIKEFEKISDLSGKISSYSQLYHSQNLLDSKRSEFYQNTNDKLTKIFSKILFFTLEINKIDDSKLNIFFSDKIISSYESWIKDLQVFKDHELSDPIEQLINEKSITGNNAWVRFFDEVEANISCEVDGKDLSLTKALNLLSNPDQRVRRYSAKSIGAQLTKKSKTFSFIYNTIAKDKSIDDEWRKYPKPISYRNKCNLIEDNVVDSLVNVVSRSFKDTSHRYYEIKAKLLNKKKLEYWDRNAPIYDKRNSPIKWDQAKDIVLNSYKSFDNELYNIADQFFKHNWIDAPASPGKASGAFSHPTVPSSHPYILLNYLGTNRDVMTLAHELGHGIHQVLAAHNGALKCSTPLTLAETASVFGEMLTFRNLLDNESDVLKRKILLSEKIEDMLNTTTRQIAFHQFETLFHNERLKGEVSLDKICEIWISTQKESLGPVFNFDEEYKYYWTYVSHFFHVPFYVYAYAFGDCLVNSLYNVYITKGVNQFEQKYIEMLKSGGTLRHTELLNPFGLNTSDSDFWKLGINNIIKLIDDLENII